MSHDHTQGPEDNERRLSWALGLSSIFLVVEVAGGILTNSLALLSDAAHMFTDVTALAIALAAIRIGKRPADAKRSYGYQRFEILAAAFNALMLFGVAAFILYEAYGRFRDPPEVHSAAMLAVASLGLVVNVIAMRLLAAGREASLNIKGAYLEVWSDLLGSVGVIGAAIAIYFTGWRWLDPAVAVAIALWVLPRTWTLLKQSTHILLEGTPADIDVAQLQATIEGHAGVVLVHDLHVWTLTSKGNVLTAHVVVDSEADPRALVAAISSQIRDRFGIGHTTLQLEDTHSEVLHPAARGAHDAAGAARPR